MTQSDSRITYISDSWTAGLSSKLALHVPISAARAQLAVNGVPEEMCREIWNITEAVLDLWKYECGTPPDRTQQWGLLGYRWANVEDADVPAYGWTGLVFDSFPALISRLLDEDYEPLTQIVKKIPLRLFWAIVTLAEAARDSDDAVFAFSKMESATHQDTLDLYKSMADAVNAMRPLIERGAKFRPGRQIGSIDALSRALDDLLDDDSDISTKDAWDRLPQFAPDVVQEVKEDTMYWVKGGKEKEVSFVAFLKRMTEARARRTTRIAS